MECETCPAFRGRNKHCLTGLWIRAGDMRICEDHPDHERFDADRFEERKQNAKDKGYVYI